jgi:nitroreductase
MDDKLIENIMDIIKKRKSVRAYKEQSLPEDTIYAILEAARYAPSARNLQQLEYKVITNKGLIKKLSDGIAAIIRQDNLSFPPRPGFPARANFFYNAPLLIMITGPKENQWIDSDAALAAQNIMLYATSIGLGTCFIGMARFIERDKVLLQELHIPKDRKIAAAVICGYADEKPAEKEKKMNAEFFK